MSKKQLTPKQQAFLDALFDSNQADGDLNEAKKLAGYDKTTKVGDVIAGLRDEILERARDSLIANTVNSTKELIGLVKNPNQLGGVVKLNAIKELMDRAGLQKVEKSEVSVSGEGGIFILPAKSDS